MKLVNPRSGEYRTVSGGGAFFGSLFLGPVYLLFKGVWTWALVALIVNLSLAAIFPPFMFLSWIAWAGAAGAIVENFYKQRGFESTGETNNRPKSPVETRDPVESRFAMSGGDRLFFLLVILLLAGCAFFVSRIFIHSAQAQTYSVPSEATGEPVTVGGRYLSASEAGNRPWAPQEPV